MNLTQHEAEALHYAVQEVVLASGLQPRDRITRLRAVLELMLEQVLADET